MTAKPSVLQEGVHVQRNLRPTCDMMRIPQVWLSLPLVLVEEVVCIFWSTKTTFQNNSGSEDEGQRGPIARCLIMFLCASKTRKVGYCVKYHAMAILAVLPAHNSKVMPLEVLYTVEPCPM